MKKIRNMRKRTGFTLVELLIVIIIIGILAGSMMLVAGSGTDRAEATKIISDLRSLKGAALMHYADSATGGWPTAIGDLVDYMDRTVSSDKFYIKSKDSTGVFVGYGEITAQGVIDALSKSAAQAGLWGTTGESAPDSGDVDKAGKYVWMILTRGK
jgi:general secretion pathway protein G